MTANPDVDELAAYYLVLAEAEMDGYCEPYARIARALAADPERLGRIIGLGAKTKVLPVLLFAAVHDLVLREPETPDVAPLASAYGGAGDPWPAFRAVFDGRFDEVAATMQRRAVQTNEVGRAAYLLAALTAVHRRVERPLAVVDIGSSAGLLLGFDRFRHRFGDGRAVGDPASPVQLDCDVVGPWRPPVAEPPPIAARTGIDLAPVDVTGEADRRWLRACVWPGLTERAARLEGAMALAVDDPPTIHRGSALDLVGPLVDAQPADAVVCVLSTWVMAYFTREERTAFGELLDSLGRRRDLAFVAMEYPGVAPFVGRPAEPSVGNEGRVVSMVGLATWTGGARTSTPLAWVHAHGRWIEWIDAASADGPTTPVDGRP